MFVQLTHLSEKTKIAINIFSIEHIAEYNVNYSKISCINPNGSFMKYFYVLEDVNTICDLINRTGQSHSHTINIYHKKSMF
jgi:hypothetical protein